MTRTGLDLLLRSILATVLLVTATAANAALYRWVDEKGHVTYSNVPPPTGARVREVVVLEEDRPPTATELRTRQILEEAERERRQLDGDLPAEAMSSPVYVYGIPDSPAPEGSSAPSANPRSTDLPSSYGVGVPGTAAPRTNTATQDPCLLSADPRCYEMNARSYDPALGYTPGARDIVPPPVGATAADAGSSSVAEANAATPRGTTPGPTVPRLTGLPPGTPVLPLTRSRNAPQPRD